MKKKYITPECKVHKLVETFGNFCSITGIIPEPTYECGCSCASCVAENHNACLTGDCGLGESRQNSYNTKSWENGW